MGLLNAVYSSRTINPACQIADSANIRSNPMVVRTSSIASSQLLDPRCPKRLKIYTYAGALIFAENSNGSGSQSPR